MISEPLLFFPTALKGFSFSVDFTGFPLAFLTALAAGFTLDFDAILAAGFVSGDLAALDVGVDLFSVMDFLAAGFAGAFFAALLFSVYPPVVLSSSGIFLKLKVQDILPVKSDFAFSGSATIVSDYRLMLILY